MANSRFDVLRPSPSVFSHFNLKGQLVAQRRSGAAGECRNMDEDSGTALGWRNEAESAFIIPLFEFAFDAHGINFRVRIGRF